jgi:hypothetical protein
LIQSGHTWPWVKPGPPQKMHLPAGFDVSNQRHDPVTKLALKRVELFTVGFWKMNRLRSVEPATQSRLLDMLWRSRIYWGSLLSGSQPSISS